MLVHKSICYFDEVRKYHLDTKNMPFDGVNITDGDVSARMEERQSKNGDEK